MTLQTPRSTETSHPGLHIDELPLAGVVGLVRYVQKTNQLSAFFVYVIPSCNLLGFSASAYSRVFVADIFFLSQAFEGQNLLISESENHIIRVVDTSKNDGRGAVVLCGRIRIPGYQNGPRANGRLNSPQGIALCRSKQVLYVCERHNHCIREVSLTSGEISPFVGSPKTDQQPLQSSDGLGEEASLRYPFSIAIDSAEERLFFTSLHDHSIRMVDRLTLHVMTLCGVPGLDTPLAELNAARDGIGHSAHFYSPRGIAIHPQDDNRIVVADSSSLRQISLPTRHVTTLYRSTNKLSFSFPVIDRRGNVFVSDRENHCIHEVSTNGSIRMVSGCSSGTAHKSDEIIDGNQISAKLRCPGPLLIDPLTGSLIVGQYSAIRVVRRVATPALYVFVASKVLRFGRLLLSNSKISQSARMESICRRVLSQLLVSCAMPAGLNQNSQKLFLELVNFSQSRETLRQCNGILQFERMLSSWWDVPLEVARSAMDIEEDDDQIYTQALDRSPNMRTSSPEGRKRQKLY